MLKRVIGQYYIDDSPLSSEERASFDRALGNLLARKIKSTPAISSLLNTYKVLAFSVYNGTDPVLGPPWPPVFFQAYGEVVSGQADLTWTSPDVVIITNPSDPMNGNPGGGSEHVAVTYQLYVTNYDWPDWAIGTTYIKNQRVTQGGVRYYSTVDANVGHQPPNASFWAVDDTSFQFYLRLLDTVTGDDTGFVLYGDSNNIVSPFVDPRFIAYGWDWPNYCPTGVQRVNVPARRCELYFYFTATSGSNVVSSQPTKYLIDL